MRNYREIILSFAICVFICCLSFADDSITRSSTEGTGSSTTPSNNRSVTESIPDRPNLIMILTDQQSIRTLGCYREYFVNQNQIEQASIWGEGLKVETPHIDRLAKEGALFTNFYTVAPLCTPSRASFMSGLYPQKTGDTGDNHGEMDSHIVTFAKVLRNNKYITGYFGKWHLDGMKKPGWGGKKRKFGFADNKYLWNRGHFKFLDEVNGTMTAYRFNNRFLFENKEEKHFTTDYLFDRGIDFIEKNKEKDHPFAMVLSIPDPHSPNEVRQPYEKMYTHMNFSVPYTAWTALTKNPALPDWQYHDHDNVTLNGAEGYLKKYEKSSYFQTYMQQYFGMVKCIDDNVGKLMRYLENSRNAKGAKDETVIVFTSDHGDMLGEHGKMNKGRPYQGSAAIPFIIRYPGHVTGGKIIRTARSSIDFAPSILSLMNVRTDNATKFDGTDFTNELFDSNMMTTWNKIVFTFDTGRSPVWAAAILRQFKLVISAVDVPWLFNLKRDPHEIMNFFDQPEYQKVKEMLLTALFEEMHKHDIPLKHHHRFLYWSIPDCMDAKDRIKIGVSNFTTCADLTRSSSLCQKRKFRLLCPSTCTRQCCKNSKSKPLWVDGKLKYCKDLRNLCHKNKVQLLCPVTCKQFTNCTKF